MNRILCTCMYYDNELPSSWVCLLFVKFAHYYNAHTVIRKSEISYNVCNAFGYIKLYLSKVYFELENDSFFNLIFMTDYGKLKFRIQYGGFTVSQFIAPPVTS